ncbi:thioester reductase domain-containing protein [Xenorhabdus khoisanae]|uniref:non-ribosomal peptide synthetase n=1 Tax=Xenorhabdus khoisanae TaxID=880157 RepID=UPI00235993D1|nr:non-ribosomal peptide synthetase [Xenorhabdus khoisanae]MDC9615520.1 thioester reductase domain-containing protein [Xenorhabdus khoisanae]
MSTLMMNKNSTMHSPQSLSNNPLTQEHNAEVIRQLRDFIREELPEAMIPTHYVVLPRLPKLPNGKIDRKQLPTLHRQERNQQAYIAPRNLQEEKIARIWQNVLSVSQISIEDSFFELGGDSLSVVQMVSQVRREFDTPINLRYVFKNPTISSLSAYIKGRHHITTSAPQNLTDQELLEEARLPVDISAQPDVLTAVQDNFQHILITGGTGYTGAFLLREFLDRSDATLWVIVRAADSQQALKRIISNLQQYGLQRPGDEERILGIPGDMDKPYLGVDKPTWHYLCQDIEMIVHNAAISSYAMPYRQLKPTNVLGTLEVLRLAVQHRLKPLHYISSLSVFPGHRGEHYFNEEKLEHPNGLVGGYRQTKWVSERLISQAGERGLPYCIYRPGQITGAQSNGACSTDTYLNAAIKSCIQLQTELPFDVILEISPVDFCAQSVAHIALSGNVTNQIYHLTQSAPVHWRSVIAMLRTYGYTLDAVTYPQWYHRLTTALEKGEDNALGKFFSLFGEEAPSKDAGDEGALPHYEYSNLTRALAGTDIVSKPLDQSLLNRYVDYFIATNFLPAPDNVLTSSEGTRL